MKIFKPITFSPSEKQTARIEMKSKKYDGKFILFSKFDKLNMMTPKKKNKDILKNHC